jgi:hypothetical protein
MRSKWGAEVIKGTGICCAATLFLAILSSQLWAVPFLTQGSWPNIIQNRSSQQKSNEMLVQIKEGTLCQALQSLGKEALGLYQCPKALEQIDVSSRTIRGTTWHSIVSQLLSDYNTIILWKNDKELKSIYLLGFDPEVTELTQVTRTPTDEENFLLAISKLRTQWANAPLSEELFNHPGFQKVFKIAEINSPEDWRDPKKQTLAKKELSKLYKTTQQKMSDSKR